MRRRGPHPPLRTPYSLPLLSFASFLFRRPAGNAEFGYYVADVTLKTCTNSYGPGCFVDQICAAGLSAACGLGPCFNAAHEASARKAIAKYNVVKKPPWKDMQKHLFDGDTGITVCTYPNGKLGDGMRYDDLVSTGFTSPVIAGLLLDRNLTDAERVNGYIRERHDGRNRTPWNEPECDLLYSRAMAHWNVFEQACGYRYDATASTMRFDPRYAADKFNCLFVSGSGWGVYTQAGADTHLTTGELSLTLKFGSQPLATLATVSTATSATATILHPGGPPPPIAHPSVSIADGVLTFSPPISLEQGDVLRVKLGGGSPHLTVHIDDPQPAESPLPRQRRRCTPEKTNGTPGTFGVEETPPPLLVQRGKWAARQVIAGLVLFVLGVTLGRSAL